MSDLTCLLERIREGDTRAAEELIPLVYEELRRMAAGKMALEAAGQTLQPTALVHEAWLRLGGDSQPAWQNRAHFFGAAAEAMRRILIDRARKRSVRKASGLAAPGDLDESSHATPVTNDELLGVHEALDALGAVDKSAAELVKLRYFVGMTLPEASECLNLSQRSAERLWTFSRAWLREALSRRT